MAKKMSITCTHCASYSLAETRVYLPHSYVAGLGVIDEEEDARQDSAYGSDDDRNVDKKPCAQLPSKQTWTRPDPGEGKIDLSCLDDDDDDDEEDNSAPSTSHNDEYTQGTSHPAPSIYSELVSHYEKLLENHAPFAHTARAEHALIKHLRSAPVTLPDVHALLHSPRPVMSADIANTPSTLLAEERILKRMFDNTNVGCNRNVMRWLAANIAYFSVWGTIGEAEVEDMLVHIVSVDPELFERVKWGIEVEKGYGVVVYPVDMNSAPQPSKKKKKKRKRKQITTLGAAWEEELRGWFAATRLHNGPGLLDRKPPEVRLPAEVDSRADKKKRRGKKGVFRSLVPLAGVEMRTQVPLDFPLEERMRVRLPQAQHL